jgi:hypothetical protein
MQTGISAVTVVTAEIRAASEPKKEIIPFHPSTYMFEYLEC